MILRFLPLEDDQMITRIVCFHNLVKDMVLDGGETEVLNSSFTEVLEFSLTSSIAYLAFKCANCFSHYYEELNGFSTLLFFILFFFLLGSRFKHHLTLRCVLNSFTPVPIKRKKRNH